MSRHSRHQAAGYSAEAGGNQTRPCAYHLPWTDEEDAFIRRNYRAMSDEEMANALDRTWSSVEIRRSKSLNLQKSTRLPNWTEEETTTLQVLYGKIDSGFLAAFLSRSIRSVRNHACLLGLGLYKRWSKDEDEIIREHYPNMPAQKFVHLLPGRDPSLIYYRAHKLRLTRGPIYMASAPQARFRTYPPELRELIRLHHQVERKLQDVQAQHRKPTRPSVQSARSPG